MTTLAIIHAGPAAPKLRRLLNTLDSVGGHGDYFMIDLISTLRYQDDFNEELSTFMAELLFGEFYPHLLARKCTSDSKVNVGQFIDDAAVVSNHVLKYLHETLLSRGLYIENGTFPYEYDSFDGRVISLRCL